MQMHEDSSQNKFHKDVWNHECSKYTMEQSVSVEIPCFSWEVLWPSCFWQIYTSQEYIDVCYEHTMESIRIDINSSHISIAIDESTDV